MHFLDTQYKNKSILKKEEEYFLEQIYLKWKNIIIVFLLIDKREKKLSSYLSVFFN